jgi:hypothetical protein
MPLITQPRRLWCHAQSSATGGCYPCTCALEYAAARWATSMFRLSSCLSIVAFNVTLSACSSSSRKVLGLTPLVGVTSTCDAFFSFSPTWRWFGLLEANCALAFAQPAKSSSHVYPVMLMQFRTHLYPLRCTQISSKWMLAHLSLNKWYLMRQVPSQGLP